MIPRPAVRSSAGARLAVRVDALMGGATLLGAVLRRASSEVTAAVGAASASVARDGRGGRPRRVRVAEGVYQRLNPQTGRPVSGKFEFTYRDGTGRQVWQTADGSTRAEARAEQAAVCARVRLGHWVEWTSLTVADPALRWLERGHRRTRTVGPGHPRALPAHRPPQHRSLPRPGPTAHRHGEAAQPHRRHGRRLV